MIVVCGEALIDMLVDGDGSRRPSPGGGPFNTARALARLGVPTAFLGRFSNDAYGQLLAKQLRADGASLALASFGPEPTTIAVARVGEDGLAEYDFWLKGTSAPNLTLDAVPQALPKDIEALHLGTLGLLLEPIASTLTELVRRSKRRPLIMLDPNIRPALASDPRYRERLSWFISQSTIVKASAEDLAWLYPGLGYEVAAQKIVEQGAGLVLVTLGAQGAYGTTGTADVSVPAVPVEVVDTIGAGDAFGAAVLAWLHERHLLRPELRVSQDDVKCLLEYACLAASLTCSRAGAEPPWRSEMEKAGDLLHQR